MAEGEGVHVIMAMAGTVLAIVPGKGSRERVAVSVAADGAFLCTRCYECRRVLAFFLRVHPVVCVLCQVIAG